MPFTLSDLALRVTRDRLATAADATRAAIDQMLDMPPAPDPVTAEYTTRAAEAASARARIETAIADAVGEVASAVAVRYAWPTVQDAPMCRRLITDRALFNLYGDVVPEDLEDRRQASVRVMGMLRNGTRILVDAAGAPYPARATLRVSAPAATLSGPDGLLDAY